MPETRPVLHVGNKNYSSWSMRPWLALRWAGLAFDEHVIPLGGQGYGLSQIPAIRAVSPSGRVPVLHVDGVAIPDSLAIVEWAAEHAPGVWPADGVARALARSAAAEMHSGFSALRRDLAMNLRRRCVVADWPADTRADLDRLFALLDGALARSGGPWLFGARCAADAFYAPVATRLRTYGVAAPERVAAWCATLFADADFRAWEQAALAEPWSIPETDTIWSERR